MWVSKQNDKTMISDLSDEQLEQIIHGLEMVREQYPSEDPDDLVKVEDKVAVAKINAMLMVLEGESI